MGMGTRYDIYIYQKQSKSDSKSKSEVKRKFEIQKQTEINIYIGNKVRLK